MRKNEGSSRSVRATSFRLSFNSLITSLIFLGSLVFAVLLAYEAPWSFENHATTSPPR